MGYDKPTSNIRMRGVLLLPCGVTLSTMSNKSAKLGTAVTVAEAQQSIARAQAPKAALFIQTTGQTYAVLSQSRSVITPKCTHPCMHCMTYRWARQQLQHPSQQKQPAYLPEPGPCPHPLHRRAAETSCASGCGTDCMAYCWRACQGTQALH